MWELDVAVGGFLDLVVENFCRDVAKFVPRMHFQLLGLNLLFPPSIPELSRGDRARKTPSSAVKILDDAEVNFVMNRLGIGSATLEEQDFLTLFEEEEPSFDEIKVAFEVFDENRDGFIDGGDLQRVLCNLGFNEGRDPESCRKMIKAFDVDGDGFIDFREFMLLMEQSLL